MAPGTYDSIVQTLYSPEGYITCQESDRPFIAGKGTSTDLKPMNTGP